MFVLRVYLAGAMAAMIAGTAAAQIMILDPDAPQPAPSPEPEPQVMEVSAAAEPDPPLRRRFRPAKEELRPGNAVVPVQRALILYLDQPDRRELDRQYADSQERWSGDLKELPRDEVREYLDRHRRVVDELASIVTLERSEYELRLQDLRGAAIYHTLLPELQNMRSLARLLALDIRLALAEDRMEDAVESLRIGFRLGEVAGTSTQLIVGRLVGLAITGMMLEHVREATTHPDAPNFYWALASLPDSLWDMQDAVEFEIGSMLRVMPSVAAQDDEVTSPEAWRQRLLNALHEFHQLEDVGPSAASPGERQLIAGLMVIVLDGPARRYLAGIGRDPDSMTPAEAILRATHHSLLRLRDDHLKWVLLPPGLSEGYHSEISLPVNLFDGDLFPAAGVLVGLMLPAINAASNAGMRGRQTVAMLATIEALRMHAATEQRFPDSLENLRPVPAWLDSVTGQLFTYELRSPTEAVLRRQPTDSGTWPPHVIVLQLRNQP